MKKRLFLSLFIAALSFANVNAQTADAEYKALTKEYMQLCNTDATIKNLIPQMMESLKTMAPDVPASVWENFEKKFSQKFSVDYCVSDMAEIYAKYLSKDDLKQIIAFYKTSAGKKLAGSAPAITQDCYQWGQKLGMQIGSEVFQELKNEGYKVNM